MNVCLETNLYFVTPQHMRHRLVSNLDKKRTSLYFLISVGTNVPLFNLQQVFELAHDDQLSISRIRRLLTHLGSRVLQLQNSPILAC